MTGVNEGAVLDILSFRGCNFAVMNLCDSSLFGSRMHMPIYNSVYNVRSPDNDYRFMTCYSL